MRVNLTPAFVLKAEPPSAGDRVVYWDKQLPCFGLMVTKGGHKSFVVQYRAGTTSRRMSFKPESRGGLSLDKARRRAKVLIGAVTKGADPLEERRREERKAKNSLQAVAERYLDERAAKLRSGGEIRKTLNRLVFANPIGKRPIEAVTRKEIGNLLRKVSEQSGPVMARALLSYLRPVFNWYAIETDGFVSPIVRGMGGDKPKARERILNDDELRAIWKAADSAPGPFGCLVQFLLLTGCRRAEAARMRYGEITGSDWVIPAERYKTDRELLIPLSDAAMAVLAKLPKIGNAGLVFTTDGKRAFASFSKGKPKVETASGVTGWTLHDLRRTARTLMSRAGVPSDHAERCIGHVIGGVRGVYDRYEFRAEKKAAFEALASLISRIVNPQSNVLELPGADRRKRKAKKPA